MERFTARILDIRTEAEARKVLAKVGSDFGGQAIMVPKALYRVIKVEQVPVPAAQILKQEMLSRGGEVAVNRGVVNNSVETSDVVLMGTKRQYTLLCKKLQAQPFKLKQIGQSILKCLDNSFEQRIEGLNCRGYSLPLGRQTLVMGILNVTPDSFSDGGKFFEKSKAVERALEMVELGADILDIGGESTRPKAEFVPAEREMERVLPVLEALIPNINIPVSVDTYKSSVAEAVLKAGAHMINDVWGLQADKDMARVMAKYDVPVVIMHNQKGTEYLDLIGDMFKFFAHSLDLAKAAGIKDENIILDPGIGFGKTTEQNLQVMSRLGEFRSLGYPILLGASRKSMIGNTLELPVDQRVEGNGATVALGIAAGADIVRVHEVKEMKRICKMTDAIVRGQRGEGYFG